jgi:hypothetical protein
MGWFGSQKTPVKVAIVGGTVVVITTVIGLLHPGGGVTVNTQAAPPQSRPVCPNKLQFTSPQNGQKVDGLAGVEVTGTACGLHLGDTVWILEQDPYDQNYYLVYDPNVGPHSVGSQNGAFAIQDQPIGDPGDNLKRYLLDAVLASKSCATSIMAAPIDSEGNYVFSALPVGCLVVDQVQILESQP